MPPTNLQCTRPNFVNSVVEVVEMIKVAQLLEPMPMMHFDIPKPGGDFPVYPPQPLSLPEPPEGWEAEELLQGGIGDFSRCGCCSTSDQVCVWGADTNPTNHIV